MNENHLSHEFLSFYDEKVKPLAMKCSKGFQTMREMENGKTFDEKEEEFLYLKNHKDSLAIWYVGLMIGDIDLYRIKGIRLNLINSLSTVSGCLNSESYWANVWGADVDSEHGKDLKELGKLMIELIKRL